jgi:hypothetical protein
MVIQRIQSLFLLIAALLMAAFAFFIPLIDTSMLVLVILIAVLAIIDIFLYKNLQRQMTVCFVDIIIGLAMLVSIIIQIVRLAKENLAVNWNWAWVLPVLSIVFLMLAHKAMSRDKKKLRDADRLR